MARDAWLATVLGVTKSWTRLSDHTTTSHEKSSKVKFHLIWILQITMVVFPDLPAIQETLV